MKKLVLALALCLGFNAPADTTYLNAGGASLKAKPVTKVMPEIEVLRAYQADAKTIILEVKACGRVFQFGVPVSRVEDPAIFDQMLDYLQAECSK
jgi:hypothetical protein